MTDVLVAPAATKRLRLGFKTFAKQKTNLLKPPTAHFKLKIKLDLMYSDNAGEDIRF